MEQQSVKNEFKQFILNFKSKHHQEFHISQNTQSLPETDELDEIKLDCTLSTILSYKQSSFLINNINIFPPNATECNICGRGEVKPVTIPFIQKMQRIPFHAYTFSQTYITQYSKQLLKAFLFKNPNEIRLNCRFDKARITDLQAEVHFEFPQLLRQCSISARVLHVNNSKPKYFAPFQNILTARINPKSCLNFKKIPQICRITSKSEYYHFFKCKTIEYLRESHVDLINNIHFQSKENSRKNNSLEVESSNIQKNVIINSRVLSYPELIECLQDQDWAITEYDLMIPEFPAVKVSENTVVLIIRVEDLKRLNFCIIQPCYKIILQVDDLRYDILLNIFFYFLLFTQSNNGV